MARRDGGFLFRFFGSAGFSYGVDRGDSPIARSRVYSRVNRTLPVSPRARGAAAASKVVPAVARRDGGFLFRFFGAGLSYGVGPRRQPDRALADLTALTSTRREAGANRLSPFSAREGSRGGIECGPGGGAPRRRISFSVFRRRRLELRGRPRRQPDRALADLPAPLLLSAFSRARARRPSSRGGGGSWPGAGAATGRLRIDSAIARTGVFRAALTLRVFSCTREEAVIAGRRVVAAALSFANPAPHFGWPRR